MKGWVLIHRRFLDWEWFDKPEMVQLFVYLLLTANHADQKWRGIKVKRGQLVTSVAKIEAATGLSTQTVRSCLKKLISTNEITSRTTSRYTIITICNYGIYQNEDDDSGKQNNKQNNKPRNKRVTNEQQTANKRLTTNNNDNNDNNDNNNFSLSLEREKERDDIFKLFFMKNFVEPAKEVERFYAHYEAQGWRRGNGRKIHNRIAAARSWEQEDKTKRRFPEPFVEAMRDICARMTSEDATMVMQGIERIEIDATNVWIYCVDPVHRLIEDCDPRMIGARLQRAVRYRVKRVN